jgi:hypothetical protein
MGSLVDSALTARKLGSCRRVVLATPRYFEKFGKPIAPHELSQHETVINARRAGGTTWTFQNGASEVSVTARGRIRVIVAEGLREAIFAGLGLTIASEWSSHRNSEPGWWQPPWTIGSCRNGSLGGVPGWSARERLAHLSRWSKLGCAPDQTLQVRLSTVSSFLPFTELTISCGDTLVPSRVHDEAALSQPLRARGCGSKRRVLIELLS